MRVGNPMPSSEAVALARQLHRRNMDYRTIRAERKRAGHVNERGQPCNTRVCGPCLVIRRPDAQRGWVRPGPEFTSLRAVSRLRKPQRYPGTSADPMILGSVAAAAQWGRHGPRTVIARQTTDCK